jgi:hypothetical protein
MFRIVMFGKILAVVSAVILAGGLATTLPPTSALAAAKKDAASGGRAAALERQRKCGAEWKEAKAGGKVEKGMTWPKYWSACNKRLKGQSA